MNETSIKTHSPNIVDQMADSTSQAIQKTQKLTEQALGGLDNSVQALREQAAPKYDEVAQRASELAHQGAQTVRDTGRKLRESAVSAQEGTVEYVREEPIKAMLIAAAAGALLMALASLLARSDR